MALVAAQCTNCNGALQVDADLKAAICPYCNTPYVVQDAINNYYTTNVYNIEHANLTVDNQAVISNKLDNAETQLRKLKDYGKAYEAFKALENEASKEFRLWNGKIQAQTCDFDVMTVNLNIFRTDDYLNELARDFDNGLAVGTNEERHDLFSKFSNVLSQSFATYIDVEKTISVINAKRKRAFSTAGTCSAISKVLMIFHIIISCILALPTLFFIFFAIMDFQENQATTFLGILQEHEAFFIILFFLVILPHGFFIISRILLNVTSNANLEKYDKLGVETREFLEKKRFLVPNMSSNEERDAFIDVCRRKIKQLDYYIKRYKV